MTIVFGLFLLGLAVLLVRERRRGHAVRRDLTERMANFREERDAAIRAVRWVPLKDPELAKLAQTGCRTCHGAGHYIYSANSLDGKFKALCQCVTKRMMNDAKYAFLGDGIPARVATQAELDAILPHEKQEPESVPAESLQ